GRPGRDREQAEAARPHLAGRAAQFFSHLRANCAAMMFPLTATGGYLHRCMHDLEALRSTIAGVNVERLDELALVKVGGELGMGPAGTLDTRIEGLLADGVNQIVT